jgi:four helix bundle protein
MTSALHPRARPQPLSDRLADFAGTAGRLARSLPGDPVGRNIANQLARSAASPVANYSEAREAVSTREYIYLMKLCAKELREARSWIRVARKAGFDGPAWSDLDREADQLIAIVVTCIKKARDNPR